LWLFEGRSGNKIVRVYVLQTGYKGRPMQHGFVLYKAVAASPTISCRKMCAVPTTTEVSDLEFPFVLLGRYLIGYIS